MEKIRKIHWRTGINRIKKSNVWLAAGINLVFLLSILLFCDMKYETSDDFIMYSHSPANVQCSTVMNRLFHF